MDSTGTCSSLDLVTRFADQDLQAHTDRSTLACAATCLHLWYVHLLRSDDALAPYLMAGAGGTITDGGAVPGGTLGVDGQFDLMAETGADIRAGRHLGAVVWPHWFRAAKFSDPGYHAARTQMLEPRVGVTWRF